MSEHGSCLLQEAEEAAVVAGVQGCGEEAVAEVKGQNTIASLG